MRGSGSIESTVPVPPGQLLSLPQGSQCPMERVRGESHPTRAESLQLRLLIRRCITKKSKYMLLPKCNPEAGEGEQEKLSSVWAAAGPECPRFCPYGLGRSWRSRSMTRDTGCTVSYSANR